VDSSGRRISDTSPQMSGAWSRHVGSLVCDSVDTPVTIIPNTTSREATANPHQTSDGTVASFSWSPIGMDAHWLATRWSAGC
jgi:hypothetical protein